MDVWVILLFSAVSFCVGLFFGFVFGAACVYIYALWRGLREYRARKENYDGIASALKEELEKEALGNSFIAYPANPPNA